MIQFHLTDILKAELPDLKWSTDYRTATDNAGTVYFEGGASPGQYDVPSRRPRYMVYISSSDKAYAEYAARKASKVLHLYSNPDILVEYYKNQQLIDTEHFYLQKLLQQGDINPIGVDNNVMDYSINFDAYLIENKEEN